jgi:hypothetical protein
MGAELEHQPPPSAISARRPSSVASFSAWWMRWWRDMRPALPPRVRPGTVNTSCGSIHSTHSHVTTLASLMGLSCRAPARPISTVRHLAVHNGTALKCTLDARRPRPARSRTHARRLRRACALSAAGRSEGGARGAATAGACAAAALLDARSRALGGGGWASAAVLWAVACKAARSRAALRERAAAGWRRDMLRPAPSSLSPGRSASRRRAGRVQIRRGRVPDCMLSLTASCC